MTPQIDPLPATPLHAYIDGQLMRLREMAGRAVEVHDVEAVHQARVATRRMSAGINLFRPVLSEAIGRKVRRRLRRVRRRLGPLRDLDVLIDHLERLRQRPRLARGAVWLQDILRSERAEAIAHLSDRPGVPKIVQRLDEDWQVLRREIDEAREAEQGLLRESLVQQAEEFARRADALGSDDPHQLRIAGKRLRYTLEMAREAGMDVPEGLIGPFKKIQQSLGDWHDHAVLTERAMARSLERMLAVHDSELQGHVLTLASVACRVAARHLNKVANLWREHSTAIVQAIHALATTPSAPPAPIPPDA